MRVICLIFTGRDMKLDKNTFQRQEATFITLRIILQKK